MVKKKMSRKCLVKEANKRLAKTIEDSVKPFDDSLLEGSLKSPDSKNLLLTLKKPIKNPKALFTKDVMVFGNGGHVLVDGKYIGRKAMVIVLED